MPACCWSQGPQAGESLITKLPDTALRLPVFKKDRQLYRVRKIFTVSLKLWY